MSKYLSLYDYLGKPAGKELGKEVKVAADQQGIHFETREISNPSFTGTVCLYPKSFLDHYFRTPDSNDLLDEIDDDFTTGDSQDYDLPF